MSAFGLAFLLTQAAPAAEVSRRDPQQTVQAFVEAYNQRDFPAFERLLDEEAVWYSVRGETVVPEISGRPALLDWTRDYLTRSCTSCRSELISIGRSGPFVTTVERASWVRRDGSPASQSSVAVYRVADGRIVEVWYFADPGDSPAG